MISDYSFYRDQYQGDLLTEELFPKYATRADAWLEYLTSGRYADPKLSEKQLLAVKFAECAASELCRQMETDSAGNPSIEKETVGDHSVTYRAATDSASGWSIRIRDVIALYLAHTGLLYRGAILQFKL